MTVQVDFRCAFLEYLLNPSNKNKKELKKASSALYFAAGEEAKKIKKENKFDIDDLNTEISKLVNDAIQNIYISAKQLEAIKNIIQKLPKEEVVFCTVLTALNGAFLTEGSEEEENKCIVNDKHYQAFAALYPIELDGHRIKKTAPDAGQAALTLSEKLLAITAKIHENNKLEENDKEAISQAYDEAKGHGIEKHRGPKEKFYNFCRVLSCIFIIPIGFYIYQRTLWTSTKTKTQEDVEKSQEAINKYIQSFNN